jgi:hypothetical protein
VGDYSLLQPPSQQIPAVCVHFLLLKTRAWGILLRNAGKLWPCLSIACAGKFTVVKIATPRGFATTKTHKNSKTVSGWWENHELCGFQAWFSGVVQAVASGLIKPVVMRQ